MADERRIQDLLRVLDPPAGFRPWYGGAGPLGSLRGVTAAQAAWRPAPDRHGIWDLVLHMAYWKYAVRRHFEAPPQGPPERGAGFPRSPSNWPLRPERPDEAAWAADRALLAEEHRRLVAAVAAFDAARLDARPHGSRKHSYLDLLIGIVQHDTYHTGQVQLLKRLQGPRPRAKR